MIALKRDIAFVELGEQRHPPELALGDAILEIVAAQDVVEVLDAIDLVLALLGTDEQPNVVPLADRLGRIERLARIRIVRAVYIYL